MHESSVSTGEPSKSLRAVLDLVTRNNPYIKAGTLKQYATTINLIEQWAGRPLTCEEFFRLEKIQEWVGWLCSTPPKNRRLFENPQPRTANTVKTKMNTARTLWRLARAARLCSSKVPSPRKFPRIKVVKEDPVAWSVEEFRLIQEFALKAPMVLWWTPQHWYTVLTVYAISAERYSAIMACELGDLQPDNVLKIKARNTKDGKAGTVPLPDWLADAIRALPRADAHWLRPGLRSKLWQWPYGAEYMRNHFRSDILEPAGLPTDRYHLFHCIRKTAITELVNLVGLEAASAQARHFSPGLTMSAYVSHAKLRAAPKSAVLAEVWKPQDNSI